MLTIFTPHIRLVKLLGNSSICIAASMREPLTGSPIFVQASGFLILFNESVRETQRFEV